MKPQHEETELPIEIDNLTGKIKRRPRNIPIEDWDIETMIKGFRKPEKYTIVVQNKWEQPPKSTFDKTFDVLDENGELVIWGYLRKGKGWCIFADDYWARH